MVKNPPKMQETQLRFLSQEDPLKKKKEDSPGEGNGYPLQYSCLENSMDRGARRATVHWVANSQKKTERLTLSLFSFVIYIKYYVLGVKSSTLSKRVHFILRDIP